ncbi:MAG: Type 1 glutamine amidotransferase-like domain-containing protein [Clostridia bacterium]|nr:Type 1 glutamine amidotransferase-like domain-containing protein [Clostridia bacterium]
MILFLASKLGYYDPEIGKTKPTRLDNRFGFLNHLKNSLKDTKKVVYVANDPQDKENSLRANAFFEALKLSGLEFETKCILDGHTKRLAKEILSGASLIYLAGGKVPKQIDFFNEIKLKKNLEGFNGVIVGESAGAICLAENVYNYPETESELSDPSYLTGLGFTNINIIPHFNLKNGNDYAEEKLNIMQIYKENSYRFCFYCLPNFSFIKQENDKIELFGPVYEMQNKNIKKIN